jgi:hypothetical protein
MHINYYLLISADTARQSLKQCGDSRKQAETVMKGFKSSARNVLRADNVIYIDAKYIKVPKGYDNVKH